MQRIRIFSLLALVAALGLVAAGCGGKKAATSGQSPEQRVKTAIANVTKINSGVVKIDATVSIGGMPGSFKVSGDGAFDTKAKGGPAFKLNMSINLGGQPQELGFTTVDGQGYMQFGKTAFAIGKAGGGSSQSTGAINPKQLKQLIGSLDGYFSDVKQDGTLQADGRTLTVYSAKVDLVRAATDAQRKIGTLPAVPGLGNVQALAGSFGDTTVRIGIGDDELPRSIAIESSYGSTGNGATSSGSLKLSALVTKVNEPVKIKKPAHVTEGQSALGGLGSMLGGLGASQ
ncbi:MAG: hypothetical protein JJE27_04450 [Thermoleophilia bacterium]|nr:hypothetical protein [Thermoleophilia bacterium]